jgi:hypothetical protein
MSDDFNLEFLVGREVFRIDDPLTIWRLVDGIPRCRPAANPSISLSTVRPGQALPTVSVNP